MDRLPRFRRKQPTIITPTSIEGKTTPPPGDLQVLPPSRPSHKLGPFRSLIRSSAKRARDSPPASLPHSPAHAACLAPENLIGRPVSPMSLKMDYSDQSGRAPTASFPIPAFLELTEHQIEAKFAQLTSLERDRTAQATENPEPEFRWARPVGPHLRLLDRYANIHPWQNHRVKLRVPEGKNDYINASPIVLHPSPRPGSGQAEPDRYIAMQGPKTASIDHVWRMVFEQTESPAVIVMLTETHEGGTEKCSQYFPRSEDPPFEINQTDEFGDGFRATVRCEGLEETPAGDAIELRKLVIRVHPRAKADAASDEAGGETPAQPDEAEERVVWHFLYKKWPDFGVPDVADLESFFTLMRLSRDKNAGPHNPRIVHCSAGVGRTGTFICLEHLMRELDAGVLEHYDEQRAATTPVSGGGATPPATPVVVKEGQDLVFDAVNELREQRKTMVHGEIQYQFIYKVLRRLWQDKYGSGETSEPAAKRQVVDPFVEPLANGRFGGEADDEVKAREA
ncbi:protein-tyrosine phosphatase-like protein [Schizothecium vesticola]|uniref:Protein-tyrosine phosphatase-like protein n=1 Tax=Schizothecium vesticola TaxID=314040 RepID=A0AA40F2K7_9PEZI|nr:protein-tyrosine phosphatase-like protein [Schizothecium vesticola]